MYIFRKDLKTMEYCVDLNVPDRKIKLGLNESPLNPMDYISDAVNEKLKTIPLNRYYDDITKNLKHELSNYIRFNIKPSQILFGNGADEMLYFLFVAARENEASFAISLAPSYFDYKSYCDSVGLKIKFMDFNRDFSFDEKEFLNLSEDKNCRMIILCNPNNPTGHLIEDEKIEYIIKNTEKLVVIDETYFEFSNKTFVNKIKSYKNLVIIRSFSKAFASAGLRFGYLITSDENAIELSKVMTAFHSSLLIQVFALSILEKRKLFLDYLNKIKKRKQNLFKSMSEIQEIKVYNSFTNFLPFTIGEKSLELFEYLKENEIAIRSIGTHKILRNFLRVTIGTEDETFLFLGKVKEFLT
jgi:histidinol-phosphate aminotransferase